MINQMESIFHSLQEAIITINISGVSFINEHGKNILKDIENKAFDSDASKHSKTRENKSSQLLQAGNDQSKNNEMNKHENQLIRARVFKLYQPESRLNSSSTNHRNSEEETLFSLFDMCKMDTQKLDKMIFMLDHQNEFRNVKSNNSQIES